MILSDEQKIIQNVLDGDSAAFEELVIANQKNVYNLALKMTANEQDALDVSQEAFLEAYAKLGSFRGESRFSVWLYRITYNLCIDFIRKVSRTQTVPLSYRSGEDDLGELEIPDMRNLPEDGAVRSETRKTISESMDELNPMHREILIMREITGMSYDEIADTLRIGTGTVKSRISRARKDLVSILVKKGTFPDGFRLKDEKEVGEHE